MEFAGELGASPKDAEKAAAEQALKAHSSTITSLPATASGRQKKKEKLARAAAAGADGVREMEENNPALTPKVKLNSICMRIVKRALQKGETAYETCQAVGGFQTTLKLVCLPGEWAERSWTGQVHTTKQAAEQSVAAYALASIEADTELMGIAEKSKLGKESKGKGRGKDALMGKGLGKGKDGMDLGALQEAMMPWLKPPRPSGPDLDREMITEEPVHGEVLEWRAGGGFGWLKLDMPYEHEKARRDGKVYAHTKDLACDAGGLQVGAKVKFGLYVDTAGLGAAQITMA